MAGAYDHFLTHRRSRRLVGHDYGAAGWYFVTICTDGRRLLFGEVRNGVMGLSEAGCVAWTCWAEIPAHTARARLGAFVVMPNHVHGLIGLMPDSGGDDVAVPGGDDVAPLHATALPAALPPSAMSAMSPAAGSLGAIVRSYKSAVTRAVRPADPGFKWQARYHDHVVRDTASLRRIAAYIEANPARWDVDRLRPARPKRG
ncbi:MAG: transposase [Bacteroidota bacterium]